MLRRHPRGGKLRRTCWISANIPGFAFLEAVLGLFWIHRSAQEESEKNKRNVEKERNSERIRRKRLVGGE
jgi:hypothetical protein